jgi:hypothetical protein
MKIEIYTQSYQILLIPSIKITYSRYLNGYYSLDLVWINKGISFLFGKNSDSDKEKK